MEGLLGRLYIWNLNLDLNASYLHAVSGIRGITAFHQGTQNAADSAGEMHSVLRTEMTGYISALESYFLKGYVIWKDSQMTHIHCSEGIALFTR